MQEAAVVLSVLRERGRRGLPCTQLYRQMFNKDLYLLAYGNIYPNKGAMTPGPAGRPQNHTFHPYLHSFPSLSHLLYPPPLPHPIYIMRSARLSRHLAVGHLVLDHPDVTCLVIYSDHPCARAASISCVPVPSPLILRIDQHRPVGDIKR